MASRALRSPQWLLAEEDSMNTSIPIVVRPASESDYPGIARVQGRCAEAAQWPVGDYSAFSMLIALAGAETVGFCAWRQVSADEAELLNLGVAPEWRRRGVASALLKELEKRARGEIFLEVAEPNAGAISLYQKHGWVGLGLRKGYYQQGRINAVVMKKRSW
jgi:ribosomal protein S18 acetylase RimI-like enzyme